MPAAAESEASSWITELAAQPDATARRRLLQQHAGEDPTQLAGELYARGIGLIRADLDRAERVVEAISWLAEDLDRNELRAQACRIAGHVLYLRTRYGEAWASYEAAIRLFGELGDEVEAARSISAALHAVIYLGRYDEAFALAERAERAFQASGDELRLARLRVNVGNIFYRQDHYTEALAAYQRALEFLRAHGDAQDVAIALRNTAVCHVSLNDFEQALKVYGQAREYAAEHHLPLLVAEADYNVAYLHYLRGEYVHAISLYQAARAFCDCIGDGYHRSLCDLDQAEMNLELNLVSDAADMAASALQGFQQLGLRYESAKAMTFLALAISHQGKGETALAHLQRAREWFAGEGNRRWQTLIDLYQALILFANAAYPECRVLCAQALRSFRECHMPSKAAVCELLLARLCLAEADSAAARAHCVAALELLSTTEAPALVFQAYLVLGHVLASVEESNDAYEAYRRAHQQLETLRSHVWSDDVKIAFLRDKLSVYEALVPLALQRGEIRQAFDFVERAKSRSLADMIAFRVHALPPKVEAAGELGAQFALASEQLTSVRRQRARGLLSPAGQSDARARWLELRAKTYADELGRTVAGLSRVDGEFAGLVNAGTVSLESVQAALGEDTQLLEYFEARGTLYACVVGRSQLQVAPVAPVQQVRQQFSLLQFQLSKFRLGADYVAAFAQSLQVATDAHLGELYQSLIAPVRAQLAASHLVIVPHGFLHYLPFHALSGGGDHLIDEFSISYAPSASVYQLGVTRAAAASGAALVFGIPDALAPNIEGEARGVAAVLPHARLFLGQEATAAQLRTHATASRVIHIATHALFRHENPIFSSIRLGDTSICLFDLYQLDLDAELVTLSGCGTGLNGVVGGDELLGLVRGWLYAGARSVLVTLWDVHDASTAEFMALFYGHWTRLGNRALALRHAVQELRERHPHPYYWAPFVLVGNHG